MASCRGSYKVCKRYEMVIWKVDHRWWNWFLLWRYSENCYQCENGIRSFGWRWSARARTRCNPHETIRGALFLNRATVKMANTDRACNFMFTNPKGLRENGLLYSADVCAGARGFSEHILWRKKWRAKGFALTLENEHDFKLEDIYAGPCETFHQYYGPKESGDVFDPDNEEAFANLIMQHTHGKGVHFVMSDWGFSVERQENV